MPKRIFSIPEAGEELGFSPVKVRALIRQGKLRAMNHSTGTQRPRWGISQAAIDAFLNPPEAPPPTQDVRAGKTVKKAVAGVPSYTTPSGIAY